MSSISEITLENSLSGYVRSHKDLIYIKNHNIVMRDDDEFRRDENSVILISGGGSGHEPFPIGFLGKGMLDVAVCGEIFTSPSVASCLAAILLASRGNPNREILIFINNYTGDRLNFGLAIEKARALHKHTRIEAITIDDDCAIDSPRSSTGRRGLTAINIAIKIAGAMVAQGHALDRVHAYCSALLCKRLIRSIGFSYRHDNINGILSDIHLGYGIHGERGSLKLNSARCFGPIIAVMLAKLKIDAFKCTEIAVLINNLGGASEFAFSHFVRELMAAIRKYPLNVVRVYAGRFLTSLGAESIGMSLIEIHDDDRSDIIGFLDHPCDGVACGHLFNSLEYRHADDVHEIEFHIHENKQIDFGEKRSAQRVEQREIELARDVLAAICAAVSGARVLLNEMDGELGDGDTGTTLSRGCDGLLRAIEALNFANPRSLLISISDILMSEMGGSSGALFSIFFQCASNAFNVERNGYSIRNWTNALSLGMDGVMKYGKAELGDRTLLDALNAGVEAMRAVSDEATADEAVNFFAKGCSDGAESTTQMRAKSGRAAYSSADEQQSADCKFPDPGAHAIAVIARSVQNVLQGRKQQT